VIALVRLASRRPARTEAGISSLKPLILLLRLAKPVSQQTSVRRRAWDAALRSPAPNAASGLVLHEGAPSGQQLFRISVDNTQYLAAWNAARMNLLATTNHASACGIDAGIGRFRPARHCQKDKREYASSQMHGQKRALHALNRLAFGTRPGT